MEKRATIKSLMKGLGTVCHCPIYPGKFPGVWLYKHKSDCPKNPNKNAQESFNAQK